MWMDCMTVPTPHGYAARRSTLPRIRGANARCKREPAGAKFLVAIKSHEMTRPALNGIVNERDQLFKVKTVLLVR